MPNFGEYKKKSPYHKRHKCCNNDELTVSRRIPELLGSTLAKPPSIMDD